MRPPIDFPPMNNAGAALQPRAASTTSRNDCSSTGGRSGAAFCSLLYGKSNVTTSMPWAETLRIEAGHPRFGVDMNTDTIPLEAGLETRAISFTKGCYVGQEVIIRVMHRGHGRVARRLVSILLPGGHVPVAGDKIQSGERVVGEITSATTSPRLGAPLALGYVQRDHAAPGTELSVNGSQARVYQPVN